MLIMSINKKKTGIKVQNDNNAEPTLAHYQFIVISLCTGNPAFKLIGLLAVGAPGCIEECQYVRKTFIESYSRAVLKDLVYTLYIKRQICTVDILANNIENISSLGNPKLDISSILIILRWSPFQKKNPLTKSNQFITPDKKSVQFNLYEVGVQTNQSLLVSAIFCFKRVQIEICI